MKLLAEDNGALGRAWFNDPCSTIRPADVVCCKMRLSRVTFLAEGLLGAAML